MDGDTWMEIKCLAPDYFQANYFQANYFQLTFNLIA